MIDATLIADLVRAGVDPDLVGRVANALVSSTTSGGSRVDTAAERRREWDRERKRATRHLRLPTDQWFKLVSEVILRDDGKCQYCGADDNLTADHIVPMTRGGTHEMDNLVACCLPCNTKKSNRLLTEWLPCPPDSTRHNPLLQHHFVHPTSTRLPPDTKNALTKEDSKKDKQSRRGERIPTEWKPEADDIAFAIEKGFSEVRLATEAEKFRNYWLAKSGQAATKLDWPATWRNWVLTSLERQPGGPGRPLTNDEKYYGVGRTPGII